MEVRTVVNQTGEFMVLPINAPAAAEGGTLSKALTYRVGDLHYRSGTCSPHHLTPHPKNARTHSRAQRKKLAHAMRHTAVTPIVVDENLVILAGHARVMTAKESGFDLLPVTQIVGLTEARKRAYLLADNRIAQDAGWDRERLAAEFSELSVILNDEGLELVDTGFEVAEIDAIVADFDESQDEERVDLSSLDRPTVCRPGDCFAAGNHLLYIGNAEDPASFDRVIPDGAQAAMGFLDPPYNLTPQQIGGRGMVRHGAFAMGSGEMSEPRFKEFLGTTLGNTAKRTRNGGLIYVCIDYRHVSQLVPAGESTIGPLINMAVWVKTNAGQGSFYRSRHELIPIFRVGDAQHLNNVQLGRFGRSRDNVWTFPGANAFRRGRAKDLTDHPTIKNSDMIAEAIKDCTRRGDIVLDCFGGAGSTLIACEKVGRRAALIEISPAYAQVTIERWQIVTGRDAVHIETGLTFDELGRQRLDPSATRVRVRTRT